MFGIYLPVDDGYFLHFQGLLFSFKLLLNTPHEINIIDMGLSDKNIKIINSHFSFLNCKIIKKNISSKDKKHYKFKIDIIEMMLKSNYEYTMMLDAKNHLKQPLSEIKQMAYLNKVLINSWGGTDLDWSHNTCLEKMNVLLRPEIVNTPQYQSNNPVFHIPQAREIMETIVKYGNDEDCLYPKGSSKTFEGVSRHRQDQSVISLSLKIHGIKAVGWEYSTYHNTIVT